MRTLYLCIILICIVTPLLLILELIPLPPEPATIKECAKSHIEQQFQPPVYVCTFPTDSGCLMSMPVGGGYKPVTVCDEYHDIPNPRFIQK